MSDSEILLAKIRVDARYGKVTSDDEWAFYLECLKHDILEETNTNAINRDIQVLKRERGIT